MAVVSPPCPEVAVPLPQPEPEPDRRAEWQALVAKERLASVGGKVAAVNQFFNSFEFVEDSYLWGKDDYWATLSETLGKNGGDCEDLAVAKYFTLSKLNIPEERMRITYVVSLQTKKPHMVLLCDCFPPQDPLVLDMVNKSVLPVSGRSDLVPVYSFNRFGYWIARQEENWMGERIGGAAKLSLWRDLLKRMEGEGDRFAHR